MRYLTIKARFYAALDTMVLLYTQYPTITPVTEEQIEDDLIKYLESHGVAVDDLDYISEESDLTLVDPQIMATLMLKDVKEALKHV